LLLVAVAGLDHSDAADICGITPEALRQRLHRVRETLSKVLERDAKAGVPAPGRISSCPSS
jgi:DNA-directed RNA polymerase specialized sigma24 family protein